MKKLVLFVAIVAAVSFSACKKTAEAPIVEEAVIEEVVAPAEEATPDTTEVVTEEVTPAPAQ
jgi:hypothetical protein